MNKLIEELKEMRFKYCGGTHIGNAVLKNYINSKCIAVEIEVLWYDTYRVDITTTGMNKIILEKKYSFEGDSDIFLKLFPEILVELLKEEQERL